MFRVLAVDGVAAAVSNIGKYAAGPNKLRNKIVSEPIIVKNNLICKLYVNNRTHV